ncbi:transglutaminase-like domain-containing protein [Anatilimnocola floriformis]|uniref:transglutaminase-like domain-containing protein n=1 Tax=Anatilimnocola floriformis TaxID=2948575 RepID=UPI0020C45C68|nr:transglutaminase family protein [Anatilimnocola floriformis]
MRYLLCCCLILSSTSAVFGQFQSNDPKPGVAEAGAIGPKLDQKVVNRYVVGVKIRAVGGPVSGLTGTFAVPTDWDDQQVKPVTEDISKAVRQHSLRSGDCNTKQVVFSVPQLTAGETANVLYTFEITSLSSSKAPTDTAGLVIPKTLKGDVRKYLQPSPQIEIANPKVKSFTKEATDGKETAWEQVNGIYEAVREKIRLDTSKIKGAAMALKDGAGSDDDFASVFVACCRAHKVPARVLFIPDATQAEFYLEDADGKGMWFPVVLKGEKAFGFRPTATVILQRGDNIRVPEMKDPQRFVAEHLTGKGNTGGKPEVEFVRKFER